MLFQRVRHAITIVQTRVMMDAGKDILHRLVLLAVPGVETLNLIVVYAGIGNMISFVIELV